MKKLQNLFLGLTLILVNACAHTKGMIPRDVEDYYVSTGVERYFLPAIPGWANFSQTGGCFRSSGLKYLNIDSLMKSYSLSYFEALQVQANFNEEYISTVKSQSKEVLTLKEDETLFFRASEKVGSKIYFTDLPTFKRINLVWLDEIRGDKAKEAKLKSFLTSPVNDEGIPVLISACMTRAEIEKMIPEAHYKSISAELFTTFNESGVTVPNMHIELGVFFKPEQKLFLYSQSLKDKILDIQGNYKVINY
jgi:hypothetical protein